MKEDLWFKTTESRVRRVFSLLVELKDSFGNLKYKICETREFIDLKYLAEQGQGYVFRFSKPNAEITTDVTDRVPVGDIVTLYAQFKQKSFLDFSELYSELIDRFADVATEMGGVPKKGAVRPNITKVVMSVLFNPEALPSADKFSYLLPFGTD